MLPSLRRGLKSPKNVLRRPQCVITSRSVFVAATTKRKKNQTAAEKNEKLQEWASKESIRAEKARDSEYQRKLSELHVLTRNVSRFIKQKEEENANKKKLQEIPLPSQVEKDAQKVYAAINGSTDSLASVSGMLADSAAFDVSNLSLVTSSVDLPRPIEDRLGLAVKYLVSKETQNWPLVLKTLQAGGGFKDLVQKDIRKFIYAIPLDRLGPLIPQLENMLAEAGVALSPKIVNTFIKSLIGGKDIAPEAQAQVEKYISFLRASSKKGILSRETYEILVEYFGKMNDLDKINQCLIEMKDQKLNPSPSIYSNILTTTVYKARDHKQAVSIFDSMKFLSANVNPDTRAYQDIIVSYVNNNDIEKALDLYQEMIAARIPLNQQLMVALARGCMSREVLKYKAWDFMFEIYENSWTPTLESLEYMLYLAAKDGDLALSRALYKKISASGSVTKRSFTFLLMAYSETKLDSLDPPVITMHEKGRFFRRNLLNEAEQTNPTTSEAFVPFLPVLDLTTAEEIMAESSALWAHSLLFHPSFINAEAYNTYLNIGAEYGTLDEFKERYEFSKLADDVAAKSTRVIVEEPEESLEADLEDLGIENHSTTARKELTKSPILSDILQKSPATITRSTITYIIALKAAQSHKEYPLAEKVWEERGLYRRSQEFKGLKISEKSQLDFQFANAMVQCLTNMKLLDDALAIIVSTEYQFKWSWAQLNNLYRQCVEIGKDTACRTIRGIAQRAQIRFEGKIKKRDYKEYVMRRGY